MLHLLSRAATYHALYGITDEYKDYLSLIKNQGEEGYCWAYSLTSAIEMRYALKSQNRLSLDPFTLINNTDKWWKERKCKENETQICEECKEYDEGGTSPICALGYMLESKKTMIQSDGEDSNLYISDFEILDITTLNELFAYLDAYKVLYSSLYANDEMMSNAIISDYMDEDETPNHAVIITSVGKFQGDSGIYIEVLNSWGYDAHYDGLVYIKVADFRGANLRNNLNVFSFNAMIKVSKRVSNAKTILFVLAVVFGSLFFASLVFSIIAIYNIRHMNDDNEDDGRQFVRKHESVETDESLKENMIKDEATL